MKVNLPVLFHEKADDENPFRAGVELEAEDFFAGPATARLKVEAEDDAIVPVARREAERVIYASPEVMTPADFSLTTFAAVARVVSLFEQPDILGRSLRWRRPERPLTIRPLDDRVGRNAWYDADRQRLCFGYFDYNGQPRHAVESHDVVAHEAGHAILDGLAPDLLDEHHPQCLAVHEAVADLVAFIAALSHGGLRRFAGLELNDLHRANLLSELAEGFAQATTDRSSLRSLVNDASLAGGAGRLTDEADPHDLSLVLSGALYDFVPEFLRKYNEGSSTTQVLERISQQMRRFLFRALGFLPPGQLTFADVGRTVIGVNTLIHGFQGRGEWSDLTRLFVERGILQPGEDLFASPPPTGLAPAPPVERMVAEADTVRDWAAELRRPLGLGPETQLVVREVDKLERVEEPRGGPERSVRETVVKVSWEREESIEVAALGDVTWQVPYRQGATAVLDAATGELKALLRTHGDAPHDVEARARGLNRAMRVAQAPHPDMPPPRVERDPHTRLLRVRNLGALLHMRGHPRLRWDT